MEDKEPPGFDRICLEINTGEARIISIRFLAKN